MKQRFLKTRRGQATVELAVLFGLVIAAFVTIQVYAKRALQARVRSGADAVTSLQVTFNGPGPEVATFNNLGQYEPYYVESYAETYQESVEQEHMGNGQIQKEKVSDLTARGAGAFQRQRGSFNRANADNLWQ
jgi:Flp pilus assembly pilin Flp